MRQKIVCLPQNLATDLDWIFSTQDINLWFSARNLFLPYTANNISTGLPRQMSSYHIEYCGAPLILDKEFVRIRLKLRSSFFLGHPMTNFLNILPGADSPEGTILSFTRAFCFPTTCSFVGTLCDGLT